MAKPNWEGPRDWSEWSEWLAAGLDGRSHWSLGVLLIGVLFATGRRTVTTWLRAAGVSDDYSAYYFFLASLGCKTESVATQLCALIVRVLPLPDRVLAIIDDTPTKRYGPKVGGSAAGSSAPNSCWRPSWSSGWRCCVLWPGKSCGWRWTASTPRNRSCDPRESRRGGGQPFAQGCRNGHCRASRDRGP